ncbi:hypothetical protein ACHHYP_06537 [Achlya hypogyna]|uniref:Uncharacterized protein n=1 Tax=Achlya hypogyna TaxID=1202772 RepID=A0A1V9YTH2_ACHHY|nr:hypothetical protein ACHHYP_06537 [Achlya hypogyna]
MYRSHEELRLLYASTILRCVNGLADASQKGAYAMAVSTLAMRIGIPLWVVDVRHEAAHTKLPALPTLQLAASTLRQWLFEHYWQPQESAIRQRVERVSGLLQRCLASQEPIGPLMTLDLDTFSKIVVPLLVSRAPYASLSLSDASPSDVGLLLRPSTNEANAKALCHELQALWPNFDAALVVALAHHVADVPSAAARCSKWLFYFGRGGEWTHGDRFADGIAEALTILQQCEDPLVQPLCGTIASYVDLATVPARLNKQTTAATGWTRCTSWTETPIGLQTAYGRVGQSLAFDDRVDDLDAGHMVVYSDLPSVDKEDPLAAYEAAFFDQIAAVVDVDVAIANDIEHTARNNHHESVPADEVSRLQDAIEIW